MCRKLYIDLEGFFFFFQSITIFFIFLSLSLSVLFTVVSMVPHDLLLQLFNRLPRGAKNGFYNFLRLRSRVPRHWPVDPEARSRSYTPKRTTACFFFSSIPFSVRIERRSPISAPETLPFCGSFFQSFSRSFAVGTSHR